MKNPLIIKYLVEQGEILAKNHSYYKDAHRSKLLNRLNKESENFTIREGYFSKHENPRLIYFYKNTNDIENKIPLVLQLKDSLNRPKEKVKYNILFTIVKEDFVLLTFIEQETN
jgi:hypothetical protein